MPYAAISFSEKFAKFSEHWSPKNIAQMNDYHFKLVKIQGDFVWHSHAETDEVFIVVEGEITIQLRDGEVALRSGEMLAVPKAGKRRRSGRRRCTMLMAELAAIS